MVEEIQRPKQILYFYFEGNGLFVELMGSLYENFGQFKFCLGFLYFINADRVCEGSNRLTKKALSNKRENEIILGKK